LSDYNIYNADAFEKLKEIESQSIDLILTDPPYNISKKNGFSSMKWLGYRGIDFGEWDKNFDITGWISYACTTLKDGGSFIMFSDYKKFTPIIEELEKSGLCVKDVIKWVKENPIPVNIERRYVSDTEFAIWAVKGKPWTFNKPYNKPYQRAEFRTPMSSGREKTDHPTQKNLALIENLVEIHSNKGDWILDPFMGSGTSGIAALKNYRNFIGIELDKTYFNISEKRINDYTAQFRLL
jgi:DNA modification methylase